MIQISVCDNGKILSTQSSVGADVGIVVVVVEVAILGSDDNNAVGSIDGGVDDVDDGIVLKRLKEHSMEVYLVQRMVY